MRVALCILLIGAQLLPAAPAWGAVVRSQRVVTPAVPAFTGLPLGSAGALSGPSLSGLSLQTGLSGNLPTLPSVQVSLRAAPAAVLAAAPLAAAAAAAAEAVPVSVFSRIARTQALLGEGEDRGGAQDRSALDSLYGEGTRRDAAPAATESLGPGLAPLGLPLLASASRTPRAVKPISARIVETTDESGQRLIEVGVSDLLRETGAPARLALARSIVAEAFAALGEADPQGARAAELSDFLRDLPGYRPEGAASVRLEMDGRNHYRLVFERADGGRRILLGEFLPEGFVLMGPAEVSVDGKIGQDHRGYWREYAGGGSRREWRAALRTEKKGWGPWSFAAGFLDAVLAEQSWGGQDWRDAGSRVVKTVETVEKRSWLGRAGARLFKAPVVGPLIEFCDKAAETVLTGLAVLPHLIARVVDGPGRGTGLETGGDLAKNPLLRTLKGDAWALERLDSGAREKLSARVRKVRTEVLEAQLFPVSPETTRRFVDADIGTEEASAVLRGHWGVGTFGRRLIRMGVGEKGWKRTGLVAAGVVLGALEGAAESVCNPILWAMLGLEAAVAAAEVAAVAAAPAAAASWGTASLAGESAGLLGAGLLLNEALAVLRGAAVSARTAGLMAGIWSLRAAHATATALWWGPWLFSATDHVGRMVQLTAEGDFDKDYFKQMSKLGTDALYYFVIP
ncbi:MAG: hypothetical protein HY926_09790 [Elusimicrobia bacterium]|nr:hypothetical protein [Elusimicrobiota bacterium]